MQLSDPLGRPVTDIEDYLTSRSGPCAGDGSPHQRSTDGSPPPESTRRRLVLTGVGIALAAIVAMAWFSTRSAAAAPAASALDATPHGVSGFAELFVATYLTAAGADEPDALAPFLATPVNVEAMDSRARYVPHVAALEVTPLTEGYWSVTVAADVLERRDGGYTPTGLRYYAVPVVDGPTGLVAAGLPARVDAPVRAVPPGTYGDLRVAADDDVVAFVTGFVEAYTTGTDLLPRFVTAGSSITAIDPAPYGHVVVTAVTEGTIGGDRWASATAIGTTPGGDTEVVTYSLRFTGEADTLRVAHVLAGPPPLGSTSP